MCHKSNFDPAPSRNGRHGTEESDRRRRARLRGLCNMFSSFVRSGSGGSTKDDFVAIFPPPQRKHEKEFRDRAFDAQIFMLCKIAHFIKSPESSVACVPQSGGKILHFRLRSNGNKFPLSDDGKTIRPSSYSACLTKNQSKSSLASFLARSAGCSIGTAPGRAGFAILVGSDTAAATAVGIVVWSASSRIFWSADRCCCCCGSTLELSGVSARRCYRVGSI